jgi:cytochrome P450
VVHHQERYFPEAERFRPERWTPQFMETLPRGAYFPFSSGERHCVGENFAWLETVLALATLVARWRFDDVPGQGIVPKPSVTLRPNKGIRVRAFRRSQGV